MKKNFIRKIMLLLCALIVGSNCLWAATYVKVTSPSDLVSGDVYIIATSSAVATSSAIATGFSSNFLTTTSSGFTESSGTITTTTATPMEFTLGEVDGIFTLKNGAFYLGYANDSNSESYLQMDQTSSTDTKEQWTIAYNDNFKLCTIINVKTTTRYIGIHQNLFKACPTNQMGNFDPATLYKKQAESSDPSSAVSFANATPSLDLKDAASFTQTATTVEGYAGTDGASVIYTITTNTAGATINASTGEVTPTQAGSVTVQATAAAIAGKFSSSTASYTLTVTDTREWTVTCHVGNNSNNVVRTNGATLSLDEPAAICGMSFVGWSSTNNAASPSWVENTTNVTSDMEVYAMFEAVAASGAVYRLVEADQVDWRGDYLIAYDSNTFADGRKGGESGIGAKDTSVNPGTNLSDKVSTTWGDNYNVTIEAINDSKLSDGYLLKTKDGKYNYRPSNSNGISLTDTRSTAAGHPLSITFTSQSDIRIANSSGAVFHYNPSGYFRFYASASQKKVYLYKRMQAVSPVYSLGTTETITPGHAKITYVTPEIMDFSKVSGLKAYVATAADGDGVTMTKVVAPVPADTPLLLMGTTGTEYNVPIVGSATTPATNLLKKGDGTTVFDGNTYDYLLYSDGKFYQIGSGTIATNKAYLHLDANPAGARSLDIFINDETMGIDAALMNNGRMNHDGVVYDLQGRRVSPLRKGLYIVNGKKMIVK